MQGATYEEFVAMVRESWEIEYTFGNHEYFYQRCWKEGAYEVYLLCDDVVVYHRVSDDMGALAKDVLNLHVYDGKTAKEAEEGISVQFEA